MPFNKRHLFGSNLDQAALNNQRMRKYFLDYFGVQPMTAAAGGTGAVSGATGATNVMMTPFAAYEYFVLGGGQTLSSPVWSAANGLEIAGDQTSTEGFEITSGIGALSLGTFLVGTDRAFFAETQIQMTDASGVSELIFGFRLNQAYQAAHTSYTDYATIGLFTSADPGLIQIKTRLASGTAVLQSTTQTWADTATKTLRVACREDGSVRFYLNGAEPIVTITGFKFAAASSVNWFLRFLHAADLADNIRVKYFSQGFQARRAE